MAPTVSVVMSVYNGAAHLAEAMESILTQNFTDFEFIIIDDGSTDETPAIIAAHDDARIKACRNDENMGLTRSLNIGLDHARGKYIARMDADDISLPNRFARQVEYLDAHPEVAVLGTAYETMTDTGRYEVTPYTRNEHLRALELFNPPFAHPTVMVRSDFFIRHNLRYDPAYRFSQDYELWSRLFALKDAFCSNLTEPLLRYRMHCGRITDKFKQQQMQTALDVRPREIRRLGLTPREREIELHNRLADGPRMECLTDILEVAGWMKKLDEANRSSKYHDPEALAHILADQWTIVCLQNTQLGLPLFNTWLGSAEWRKASPPLIVKMLIKCMLRWDPHRKTRKGAA